MRFRPTGDGHCTAAPNFFILLQLRLLLATLL
jgi:hypothetical protein